jgi:hypothetical protein
MFLSFFFGSVAVTPTLTKKSTLKQQVRTIEKIIDEANNDTWNERGLNILSPRKVAFQFVGLTFPFVLCFSVVSRGGGGSLLGLLVELCGRLTDRTRLFRRHSWK